MGMLQPCVSHVFINCDYYLNAESCGCWPFTQQTLFAFRFFLIVALTPSLFDFMMLLDRLILIIRVELPPAKRRRGLAGSIVSTALSAALIGTAVGLTVYRL